MRFFAFSVILCVWLCACDSTSQQRVKLKSKQDSVSYANGVMLGKQIKQQNLEFDINIMSAGMKDAMGGGKAQMTDEQIQQILTQWQSEQMAKRQEQTMKQSEENKKKGDEFLANNKKQPGVQTTASGLQYKVLSSGKGGDSPKDTSVVKVHYKGTLINGTEFDSSYKRGEPTEFPVNGVIPGWTEALKLMKAGDKWQLFIPANLAYGMNAPPSIGPNQVLIFEVELLEIKK